MAERIGKVWVIEEGRCNESDIAGVYADFQLALRKFDELSVRNKGDCLYGVSITECDVIYGPEKTSPSAD